MKKILNVLILCLLVGLVSCEKENNITHWGKTEYFDGMFYFDYDPVIMTRTLKFELNSDGQDLAETEFVFDIYEMTPEGECVKARDIIVYKNGATCQDNMLKVKGNEGRVDVGIEFTPEAREGNHTLFLKHQSLNGLDDINLKIGDFVAEKENIMNPANFYLMWTIIILGVAYILWYLLVILPKPRVNSIELDYSESGYKRIKMNGSYELVCTSDRKRKDGFFRKMFCGTRKFEYDDFWTHEVTISPRSSRATSAIKVMPLKGFEIVGENMRKESFDVVNADGSKKVTITTS